MGCRNTRASRAPRCLASLFVVPLLLLGACAHVGVPGAGEVSPKSGPGEVVGIHLLGYSSDALLAELGTVVPDLAAQGVNLIVLEVDYSFAFESHPELRQPGQVITREGARAFADICRRHGIRLIPQFQSLGHQSWAENTGPLLTVYPELDITPGAFPNNEGIYCREWDPTNPSINEIVFPMIDEIVDAFGADGIHVGMDEVFLLGSDESPTTKGKDPAALFARVVNEFHDHFVKDRGLEMFIWGDRFIDATAHGYGSWEASMNGTAPAVDMVPKDIVICDWHYAAKRAYTSVDMFTAKGFRVLPSSWRDLEGVETLIKYSYGLQDPNMAGHLFTTWRRVPPAELKTYPPLVTGVETIRGGRWWDVTFDLDSVSPAGTVAVRLAAPSEGLQIHYTTDGSTPTPASARYAGPVEIDRSATVRAIAVRDGQVVSDPTAQAFEIHAATGKPVTLATPPSPKYPTQGGVGALVNGMRGSGSYADGQWLGLEGPDLEAVIDLGTPTPVRRVRVGSLHDPNSWIYVAAGVEVSGSADGADFQKLGGVRTDPAAATQREDRIVRHEVTLRPAMVRYLAVHVRNRLIPAGFDGAGVGAWLFVDEIEVE